MTLKELTDKLSAAGFTFSIKRKANPIQYGIIELIPLNQKKYPHINDAKLHYVNENVSGVQHYTVTAYIAHTKKGIVITGSSINNFVKRINEYNK